MVKHIVMWKVREHEVHGSKEEVMRKIKEALEGLKGHIDGLEEIEVGLNFNESEAAYDVVLYSVLTNKEALAHYQAHPEHLKVANGLVRPVTVSRVVVDYTV